MTGTISFGQSNCFHEDWDKPIPKELFPLLSKAAEDEDPKVRALSSECLAGMTKQTEAEQSAGAVTQEYAPSAAP